MSPSESETSSEESFQTVSQHTVSDSDSDYETVTENDADEEEKEDSGELPS